MADDGAAPRGEYPLYDKELEQIKDFLSSYRTPVNEKDGGEGPLKVGYTSPHPELGVSLGMALAIPPAQSHAAAHVTAPLYPLPIAQYVELLKRVERREIVSVFISLGDLILHGDLSELVDSIKANTRRYVDLFSRAIDALLPPPDAAGNDDVLDVLMKHRMRQAMDAQKKDGAEDANAVFDVRKWFPAALMRRFEVRFINQDMGGKFASVRDVGAKQLGKLVVVKAIVIRASEIKPMIQVASYAW